MLLILNIQSKNSFIFSFHPLVSYSFICLYYANENCFHFVVTYLCGPKPYGGKTLLVCLEV